MMSEKSGVIKIWFDEDHYTKDEGFFQEIVQRAMTEANEQFMDMYRRRRESREQYATRDGVDADAYGIHVKTDASF